MPSNAPSASLLPSMVFRRMAEGRGIGGPPTREKAKSGSEAICQSVSAATQKLKKATIAQDLQLLAYLLANVLIHWVKSAQMGLECVDVLEGELIASD